MKKIILIGVIMLMSIISFAQTKHTVDTIDVYEIEVELLPVQNFITKAEVDSILTHPPRWIEDSLGYAYLYTVAVMERID